MRWLALPLLLLVLLVPASTAASPPTLPGARACSIFPANNPWNERVDRLPVAADSQAMIAAIGADAPVHADFGSFDVEFIDRPDPIINTLGCRGVGEIGITGVAAAIANAVYHATGTRLRELPMKLPKAV